MKDNVVQLISLEDLANQALSDLICDQVKQQVTQYLEYEQMRQEEALAEKIACQEI